MLSMATPEPPSERASARQPASADSSPAAAPPTAATVAPASPPTASALDLPVGTVTFVFTDIEGSTRLLQRLGDGYGAVLEHHNAILRGACEGHGGVVFATEGDAFAMVFRSVAAAVATAVEAQRSLAAFPWPDGTEVRVRMGIHTGEVSLAGDTYVGLDIHRAARITAAGHGGQVLVSAPTRALVENALPDGVTLRDLGERRLKDLSRPEHIFQLVIAGLASQFPDLRTLDAIVNNLPTQLTSFVGRTREVEAAKDLLQRTRLLTLTGPGGTGKTRLSLQVAAEIADRYPDGAFFVPLESVTDPELVASAIVTAIGIQDSGQRSPRERLFDHVAERRILFILDNFEQVLGAAPLIGDLLRAAPGCTVIVSSRAVLHVSGEQEYPVPPLGLPDVGHGRMTAESLSQYEGVTLFIERAVAVRPDFRVTNENAAAVAEICARLDGLPLAIELAAARVKLLPPEAILARLGQRLSLLSSGARDLPARQQTLRGAIAWSYDLLDPGPRRLLARAAVFVGGMDLELAERVCGPADELGIDVFDGLAGLVDQSLVRQIDASGEARFGMLQTIRDFALEQLADSGEGDEIRRRHADAFLDLVERAEPLLTGPEQRLWLDRLELENDNIRAALAWTVETGRAETALRVIAGFWRFWQMRGYLGEGRVRAESVLAMPHAHDHPASRRRGLVAAGGIAYWQGDMDRARAVYKEALAIARAQGDRPAIAEDLYNLSFVEMITKSNVPLGREYVSAAVRLYRELDDQGGVARSMWALGNAEYFFDNPAAARANLVEAVERLRTLGDQFGLGWALHTLGLAELKLGNVDAARTDWTESLGIFAAADDVSGINGIELSNFRSIALQEGDLIRAVRLGGASAALVKSSGADLSTVIDGTEGRVMKDAPMPDRAEIAAAWAEGQAMSPPEAVAYALERAAPSFERRAPG